MRFVLFCSVIDDNNVDYLIKVVPPPRFPIIKLVFLFTPRTYLFYRKAIWNYSLFLCKLSKKMCMFSWACVFFHYIKWAIIHYCDYLMVSSNYLQFNQWEAIQVECSHPVSVCRCCLSSSFLGSTGRAGLTFQFVSLQLIPVLRENVIEIQSGL